MIPFACLYLVLIVLGKVYLRVAIYVGVVIESNGNWSTLDGLDTDLLDDQTLRSQLLIKLMRIILCRYVQEHAKDEIMSSTGKIDTLSNILLVEQPLYR